MSLVVPFGSTATPLSWLPPANSALSEHNSVIISDTSIEGRWWQAIGEPQPRTTVTPNTQTLRGGDSLWISQ